MLQVISLDQCQTDPVKGLKTAFCQVLPYALGAIYFCTFRFLLNDWHKISLSKIDCEGCKGQFKAPCTLQSFWCKTEKQAPKYSPASGSKVTVVIQQWGLWWPWLPPVTGGLARSWWRPLDTALLSPHTLLYCNMPYQSGADHTMALP